MKQEEIERILLDTISADVDEDGRAYWYGAPEAAAGIARLFERVLAGKEERDETGKD